jgi:HSP20 family protein
MATLVRWDPFREVAAVQNEMSRFLNLFREGNGGQAGGTQSWAPAMDVWETEGDIVYAFDLPGIPQDEISVEFEDGALTVSAQRERTSEVSDERLYRVERRFGSFSRTIGLPQGVTDEQISARYDNGVLEVHVGKPQQVKPRKIEIGPSEQTTIEGNAKPAA